jgi:hypothetical protein
MPNRRVDAIYFTILLAAALIGFYASVQGFSQAPEEANSVDLPDFETPELMLEVPFDFPYAVPAFANRKAPLLRISDNVESVLVEVRSVLLASAKPVEVVVTIEDEVAVEVEVEDARQLAAAVD